MLTITFTDRTKKQGMKDLASGKLEEEMETIYSAVQLLELNKMVYGTEWELEVSLPGKKKKWK